LFKLARQSARAIIFFDGSIFVTSYIVEFDSFFQNLILSLLPVEEPMMMVDKAVVCWPNYFFSSLISSSLQNTLAIEVRQRHLLELMGSALMEQTRTGMTIQLQPPSQIIEL
jgi:hypothetical protein